MTTTSKLAINTAWFSIVGNLALVIIKGATGILGNSFALIADAIESMTDVFASALVLLGLKYSTKPADENHPYGHGKVEPLITFVVVGFLMVSATIIAYESIRHLHTPQEMPAGYTLVVLLAVVAIKEFAYRFVARRGDATGSTSLKADAWHHRSDAITSLIAFIGISIAIVMGPGYETADDWAALVASGFIMYNAYLIFRPALGEIMDEQLHSELIEQIRAVCAATEGVVDTEKCYVRKSGLDYHVDLHLRVRGELSVREGHSIAHRAKRAIRDALPEILDVLIHVEPDAGP